MTHHLKLSRKIITARIARQADNLARIIDCYDAEDKK